MSAYAWIITKDYIGDGDWNREGWVSPRTATEELLQRLRKGEGARFTMFDDDGNHYYSGRIIGEYEGSTLR